MDSKHKVSVLRWTKLKVNIWWLQCLWALVCTSHIWDVHLPLEIVTLSEWHKPRQSTSTPSLYTTNKQQTSFTNTSTVCYSNTQQDSPSSLSDGRNTTQSLLCLPRRCAVPSANFNCLKRHQVRMTQNCVVIAVVLFCSLSTLYQHSCSRQHKEFIPWNRM